MKKWVWIIGAIVVVAGIAGTIVAVNASQKPPAGPYFSFEGTLAPNWWAGKMNYPKADPAYKDSATTVPDGSMTIISGTEENPGSCFVNYFYMTGTTDIATAKQTTMANSVAGQEGASLEEIATQSLTMETFEGPKPYTLSQYDLKSPASASLATGIQLGYVQLNDGYIEMRGYCNTAEELAATVPIFQSVSFKTR